MLEPDCSRGTRATPGAAPAAGSAGRPQQQAETASATKRQRRCQCSTLTRSHRSLSLTHTAWSMHASKGLLCARAYQRLVPPSTWLLLARSRQRQRRSALQCVLVCARPPAGPPRVRACCSSLLRRRAPPLVLVHSSGRGRVRADRLHQRTAKPPSRCARSQSTPAAANNVVSEPPPSIEPEQPPSTGVPGRRKEALSSWSEI